MNIFNFIFGLIMLIASYVLLLASGGYSVDGTTSDAAITLLVFSLIGFVLSLLYGKGSAIKTYTKVTILMAIVLLIFGRDNFELMHEYSIRFHNEGYYSLLIPAAYIIIFLSFCAMSYVSLRKIKKS